MNVLVTGAGGFVGKQLCKKLTADGVNVTGMARSPVDGLGNIKLIVKELNSDADLTTVLTGIDAVIHLAGRAHVMKETTGNPYQAYADINIGVTKRLAESAVKQGVKRFVFLSSVKVNGERTTTTPFTENDQPEPESDYGKTKYKAEKDLIQISEKTEMEVVIIRPPLVYGQGVKANFKSLIELCQSNMPLPLGAIHNKRSFIYIENLISFIIKCIDHPKAANQTFLISDDSDISTTQLIRYIKLASNKKTLLIPVPVTLLKGIFDIVGKASLSDRMCGDLQVDVNKAKTLLDWKPPYTVQHGIATTIGGERW